METSDEELEWREIVHSAKREIFKQQQHAHLWFWWGIFVQILKTSAQISVVCLVLLAALTFWTRSFHPTAWP